VGSQHRLGGEERGDFVFRRGNRWESCCARSHQREMARNRGKEGCEVGAFLPGVFSEKSRLRKGPEIKARLPQRATVITEKEEEAGR